LGLPSIGNICKGEQNSFRLGHHTKCLAKSQTYDVSPRDRRMPRFGAAFIFALLLASCSLVATDGKTAASPPLTATAQTALVVQAATEFLDSLDETQRKQVWLAYRPGQAARPATFQGGKDGRMAFVGEQYGDAVWSNYPVSDVPRPGLALGSMTARQRDGAMHLLHTVLSAAGYQKVLDIMGSDEALTAQGNPFPTGTATYTIGIFGNPDLAKPWMVQFGGHHLGLNITIVGERGIMTPTLTGAQPAVYTSGTRTIRALARENDKAFDLMAKLDQAQRGQAVLNYRVGDLVLGPGQAGRTIQPEGLKASDMSEQQRAMLLDLISEWAGIINEPHGSPRMQEIKAGLNETRFAWSGPLTHEPGRNGSSYYRIQGPRVWIEFSPQGVGGDPTMHVHTMYRDPTNDYGSAVLARGSASSVVGAADAFIASLDAAQRQRVLYEFNDDEQRARWSNFPTGVVRRGGVSLRQMSPAQRDAAMQLLATVLSPQGLEKVNQIRQADEDFKANGSKRGPPGRGAPPGPGAGAGTPPPSADDLFGSDLYFISFIGRPSSTSPWMLQFGGHHLALNITMAGDRGVLTPTLTGAQPAVFNMNGRTIRPLGRESDKALALMKSLDEAQRREATLGYTVADLVLGPGQDGKKIIPDGLKASKMNDSQRAMLLDLISEWSGIMNADSAAVRLAQVKEDLDDTWFAWSGAATQSAGSNISAYYRIQGPRLVIEYAPQSDEPVNHVHTIYRDPTNDYGRAPVRP
jgi:hypothetical protein